MNLPAPLRRVVLAALSRAGYDVRKRSVFGGAAGEVYDEDGLSSVHNHDFLDEPDFRRAYERAQRAQGEPAFTVAWRAHIAIWAARTAARIPGDFVECGCGKGFVSSAVLESLDQWGELGKSFWMFDTFQGLAQDRLTEQERSAGSGASSRKALASGRYATDVEAVRANFAAWPRIHVVQGLVPDTLPLDRIERVAFLHIDMNCVHPEVEALRALWDRLSPAAPVLLDDYAYLGSHLQKHAMDRLGEELGFAVASLPTGQGLIIKT